MNPSSPRCEETERSVDEHQGLAKVPLRSKLRAKPQAVRSRNQISARRKRSRAVRVAFSAMKVYIRRGRAEKGLYLSFSFCFFYPENVVNLSVSLDLGPDFGSDCAFSFSQLSLDVVPVPVFPSVPFELLSL